MISVRKEIENYFALKTGNGAYRIKSLGKEFKAWVLRNGDDYGVIIPYDGEPVAESFSGAYLRTQVVGIEGENSINYIFFYCNENCLRNEFSLICEDFVYPKNRDVIINNPIGWWKKWKELLGNAQHDKLVYDIIGELLAVLKLYEEGKKPYWSAMSFSSHDIETDNMSFEVKSTLKKEKSMIHISSQFQLDASRPLAIIFTRLEESTQGLSIDDILSAVSMYDKDAIKMYNEYLEARGFVKGNQGRKQKYRILERRKIIVNEKFPKITAEMFKENKFPDNISYIEYDVSLDGLEYYDWK